MKKVLLFFGLLGTIPNAHAQKVKPTATTEKLVIEYKGKKVKARKLTVCSEIPMALDRVWANVKTPALLQFVAKGMIRFKPVDAPLPKQWVVGETYGVCMRVFGFIPFGGKHYLFIEKIDDNNHTIATKEWDKGAKVWNHDVVIRALEDGKTYYEDSITIYGGMITGCITAFAKRFYVHRQKRWLIVAKQNLDFVE